jgi:hypothetical protein
MATGRIIRFAVACAISMPAAAALAQDDQTEAVSAAKGIMASLANKDFEGLWNEQTSDYFKNWSKGNKDAFIAKMSISRSTIGNITESNVLDLQVSPSTASDYVGTMYTVTFANNYTTGSSYEYVIVIKEGGSFKMSGFGGVPKPQGPGR